MFMHRLVGCSAVAIAGAGLVFATLTPTEAAMTMPHYANALTQRVDCAVGAHIGPLGGCIIGTDDPPPRDVVVEPRDPNAGCQTKSVTRTDAAGNSETKTRTDC
jgi:hypothetical protein